jgi:hypothetical protein
MKMKQIKLDEATDEQLADFAESMQLELDSRERSHVLAKIGVAWEKDYVLAPDFDQMIDDMDGEMVQAQQANRIVSRLEGGIGQNDPKFIIKIGSTEQPGGKDPVPVSVNGRAVVIQRNKEIEIPARYYYALQHAKRSSVEQDEKTYEITETEFSNYPVETVQMPSRAELAEWHARVDRELMPA